MSIFDEGGRIVPDLNHRGRGSNRILLRIGEAPWLADLSRRVQHYGYRGRGSGRQAPAPAFPRWTEVMAEHIRPLFAAALPGMHADRADFGPVVVSLSLGAAWRMQFRAPERPSLRPRRPAIRRNRRAPAPLGAGVARTRWMHGIDRIANTDRPVTRVSATFRTLAA